MAKKVKEIQISTLEGRFKKLHDAANFAEENCRAIAFHVDELNHFDLLEEQIQIIDRLKVDIEEWCNKFVRLAEQMQDIESQYWDCMTEDKTKCILIEDVPTYSKSEIPNIFQMTEKLFEIGYYSMDGSTVQNHQFSKETILLNIKELCSNTSFCLKALANANYNGVWKPVEQTISDIFDSEPTGSVYSLLEMSGITDD